MKNTLPRDTPAPAGKPAHLNPLAAGGPLKQTQKRGILATKPGAIIAARALPEQVTAEQDGAHGSALSKPEASDGCCEQMLDKGVWTYPD
jgi:hypothetical protein